MGPGGGGGCYIGLWSSRHATLQTSLRCHKSTPKTNDKSTNQLQQAPSAGDTACLRGGGGGGANERYGGFKTHSTCNAFYGVHVVAEARHEVPDLDLQHRGGGPYTTLQARYSGEKKKKRRKGKRLGRGGGYHKKPRALADWAHYKRRKPIVYLYPRWSNLL